MLFSTHQLDLVERLCDRLVVMARGRGVAAGLGGRAAPRGSVRYRLVLGGDAGWTRDQRGLQVADLDGSTALLEVAHPVPSRRARRGDARGPVHEFRRVVPGLSEIYQEVTA